MRNARTPLWALLILVLSAPTVFSNPEPKNDADSIVIVFKDGHQQTFRLADIARIEFNSPAESGSTMERGHFMGKWKVGDGAGGTFFITLRRDGSATKTLGSSHGTWTVVNGEARISWDDGWHDAIRRVGRKYQKVAFGPRKSFSDEPSNIADAEPTEPI
jgi:hypothetical protein